MGRVARDEPLGRLLAMALSAVIEELHDRLERGGWGPTRPLWGFVLLSVRESPQSITGIGGLLGISKQAAAKVVGGLSDAGLVRRRDDPADRRATAIVLTQRGERFLVEVEAVYAEIEAEWTAVIGARRAATLRASLAAVLDARYGEEPPPLRPVL